MLLLLSLRGRCTELLLVFLLLLLCLQEIELVKVAVQEVDVFLRLGGGRDLGQSDHFLLLIRERQWLLFLVLCSGSVLLL